MLLLRVLRLRLSDAGIASNPLFIVSLSLFQFNSSALKCSNIPFPVPRGLQLFPRLSVDGEHDPVLQSGTHRRPRPHPDGRHRGLPRREQHDGAGQPGIHREAEDPERLPEQLDDQNGDQLQPGGSH